MNSNHHILSTSLSVRLSKYWHFVKAIIFYAPWIWLTVFGLFVATVTVQIGHFPFYGQPDPKFAGLVSLLYFPTILLLMWTVGSTLPGLLLIGAGLWKALPTAVNWHETRLYLLGLVLFYGVIITDFLGLMTWLMD